MQEDPVVSVLMTAYNREQFIAEAIESVLASTYKNFELIIVDDCSNDKTVQVAKRYLEKDSRVTLYVNERNLGDYLNRNRAADYARGRYLKYLDSDDVLLPHGLMQMVRAIEGFPGAGMAMMWTYDDLVKAPKVYSQEMALKEYFINHRWLMVGPSGCIYDREKFFELGKFSGRNYIGDFEFNLKCALRYPVVRMQNNLIFYRVHEQQQTFDNGHAKTFKVWLYKIQKQVLLDQACPLKEVDKLKALKKATRLQARRVVFNLLKTFDFALSLKMIRESDLGWKNLFRGLTSFR